MNTSAANFNTKNNVKHTKQKEIAMMREKHTRETERTGLHSTA